MAEAENNYFIKGHNLDLKYIRLDLYRLLCYFESSKQISLLKESDDYFFAKKLSHEFMYDEISRILLSCAGIIRIIDDESEEDDDEFEEDLEEKNPFFCGTLEYKKKNYLLSLRDACNKIIHAQKINFDIEQIGENKYFLPKVFMYGYRQKEEWKATIDIPKFVDHCTRLLTTRTMTEFSDTEHIYK